MGRTTVWPAPITGTIPGTPNCACHVERGITSQGLRARRDTVIARTINANAPVKTKSAKPNLFGGGGRLGHVPLRARAWWRKCWPCAYAPVDSMHLCRIHWFFLLCLSLCGMISLESSGVVLVQVFLNRTTATGHGANQDLSTSRSSTSSMSMC